MRERQSLRTTRGEVDLGELAATTDDDAEELGANVGLGEPAFELGPLLLEHAEADLGLAGNMFSALCAVTRIDDGFEGDLSSTTVVRT